MTAAMLAEASIIGPGIALIGVQWAATMRIKGSAKKMQVRLGVSLLLRSWQIFLALSCVVLASVAIALRVSAVLPFGVIEAVIATAAVACACICLSYVVVPPSIVVLGRSAPSTRRLVRSLTVAVFPLRVTHLLYVHPLVDPFAFLTGLRNRDPRRWRKSIRDLMALTGMVAINASQVSPALVREATAALAGDIVEKAVFVVPDSNGSALLESVLANIQVELPHIMVASPGQLARWMRGLAWKTLKPRANFSAGPMATALIASRRRWSPKGEALDKSICDEALRLLKRGATTGELCEHIDSCEICQVPLPRFAPTIKNGTIPSDSTIPRTLFVGVDGPVIEIADIVKRIQENNLELVIFGADSPGSQNLSWSLDAVDAMVSDPELCLIVEDDRISPFPIAPCIAVRRSLLLQYPLTGRAPLTLRDLANQLMQVAEAEGRTYRKQALVEVPLDLL